MEHEIYLSSIVRLHGQETVLHHLDTEEIRRVFTYRDGGKLHWNPSSTFKGDTIRRAADTKMNGIPGLRIGSVTIPEVFFVWVYHAGKLPSGYIRFLDRRRANTRIENLEDATMRTPKRFVPES